MRDGVHVGGVVLEGGGRGEGWGQAGPQEVPVLAILIHHPDVVVILGPGFSVDHICFVWRTERKPGGCPQNGVNVLKMT